MREAALDEIAREAIRTSYLRRMRAVQLAKTAHKFTPSPRKRARFSTRGEPHPSYFTKRHTPSRQRDLTEMREVT